MIVFLRLSGGAATMIEVPTLNNPVALPKLLSWNDVWHEPEKCPY
jgi:hypothetical protein